MYLSMAATLSTWCLVCGRREVDEELAAEIREFRSPTDGETRMFYEIVIAPGYTEAGLAKLRGKSKTLRILEAPPRAPSGRSLRQVGGEGRAGHRRVCGSAGKVARCNLCAVPKWAGALLLCCFCASCFSSSQQAPAMEQLPSAVLLCCWLSAKHADAALHCCSGVAVPGGRQPAASRHRFHSGVRDAADRAAAGGPQVRVDSRQARQGEACICCVHKPHAALHQGYSPPRQR
jgi:AICARFT/IMPCHase bienzyme